MENLKRRAVKRIKEQASRAFEEGYKWLFEMVNKGMLDYDDLCTITACEEPSDTLIYFMGDYREAIMRLRKASPEFFKGVKKAAEELLKDIREPGG